MLDPLELADRLAEGVALVGVVARRLHAGLGPAQLLEGRDQGRALQQARRGLQRVRRREGEGLGVCEAKGRRAAAVVQARHGHALDTALAKVRQYEDWASGDVRRQHHR